MADKYVSPAGSDGNSGTEGSPYLTIEKGLENISAGETVWLRGNAGNFVAQVIDSAGSNGSAGNPKLVKAYPGEQAVIGGRLQINQRSYIKFVGHPDVRLGRTADTIRVATNTADVHPLDVYGTGLEFEGMDIDRLNATTSGSAVNFGWNGQEGQWRCVDCKLMYCLSRNVGLGADPHHDHGIYLNYNLNNEIGYNVFSNIAGGYGIHLYSESASARHVDGTYVHHNTVYGNLSGGIILASDGTSTTQNSVVNNNLVVNSGRVGTPGQTVYSFEYFWGGPTGTGNTGDDNHSYNPLDGHVRPGMTGWTLEAPTTGDPLFVNAGTGDFRLQVGSPAAGKGAFPSVGNLRGIRARRSGGVRR